MRKSVYKSVYNTTKYFKHESENRSTRYNRNGKRVCPEGKKCDWCYPVPRTSSLKNIARADEMLLESV